MKALYQVTDMESWMATWRNAEKSVMTKVIEQIEGNLSVGSLSFKLNPALMNFPPGVTTISLAVQQKISDRYWNAHWGGVKFTPLGDSDKPIYQVTMLTETPAA